MWMASEWLWEEKMVQSPYFVSDIDLMGFFWVISLNGHTIPTSRCYHPIL